jgi:hypothetical protein
MRVIYALKPLDSVCSSDRDSRVSPVAMEESADPAGQGRNHATAVVPYRMRR